MPPRKFKKILIIGSGPIVIGQACEFDYSGTQAIKVLKREGYKIVLVNSNPATIMTDPELADSTYIEPLIPEVLEKIIEKERPDALLPTMGGQTALNLSVELAERGILDKYGVKLIGASLEAIKRAENRELFKRAMLEIGLDVLRSSTAHSLSEATEAAEALGFPLILRPSFTLGGTGSAIVFTQQEFAEAAARALEASPVTEVLVEESVLGWKEFELEVMRDIADNCVVICSIENFDPMGVHTGDSITVAPVQTLTDKEYQILRDQAFACIRKIGVDTGGSNIQFAVHPQTGRVVLIEMNPRVSRSSALASKATGFPIAKIAALLAVGWRLDEIPNEITRKTPAAFEPTLDYVVVKIPRFAFEKFPGSNSTLGTSMKSVGEVMSIGRTFPEALQKAIRGLEIGRSGLGADGKKLDVRVDHLRKLQNRQDPSASEEITALLDDIRKKIRVPSYDRIFYIRHALQLGLSTQEINDLTSIDPWFLEQIKRIVDTEDEIREQPLSTALLRKVKKLGFSDTQIAHIKNISPQAMRTQRKKAKVTPTYNIVDTCAAEFPSETPYLYSTYEEEDEALPTRKRKIVILGGGPNRIGQGIEFDYCCVQVAFTLREEGYEVIMVNSNPETVSTDYDTSDRLYFEPLTLEDVLNIVDREKPLGVIVQFGGQTPLNLALPLAKAGVKILGTSPNSIDLAEDRKRFGKLLSGLSIPQPEHGTAKSLAEAIRVATRIGYPVMIRPSYVLGGRAMQVAENEATLKRWVEENAEVSANHPILIDRFLMNAIEIDVDALSDGRDVFIGGVMEHIEEAGVHSGDSACALPPRTISGSILSTIETYTRILAQGLKVKGLLNLQLAVKDNTVYVLEVNPRASRTVPFVSKATGIPLAKLAAQIIAGHRLKDILRAHGIDGSGPPKIPYVAVKEAVIPWERFPGVDIVLGPEMRSTGEVMGIDKDFQRAFAKSQAASGALLPQTGAVLMSLKDADKTIGVELARKLTGKGLRIYATSGTADILNRNGVKVEVVKKIADGRPHVVDIIQNKQVGLVINTPSQARGSREDGYQMRQAALPQGIPIVTTIPAAQAAIGSLEYAPHRWNISSLQNIHPHLRRSTSIGKLPQRKTSKAKPS